VAEIIPPTVTLIAPQSTYNDTSSSIIFNCSASDNVGLANITLYITNSTGGAFSSYQTTALNTTPSSTAWTVVLGKGNYTWNCKAYDTSRNSDWGDTNRSLYINYTDTTPPTITLDQPSDGFSCAAGSCNLTFGCSATDDFFLENISLYLTNSSDQGFSLNSTSQISGVNDSTSWNQPLELGNYTWNCQNQHNLWVHLPGLLLRGLCMWSGEL